MTIGSVLPPNPFPTVYTQSDRLLLAKVDEAFGYLSGPATKHLLWRQYHVHGDKRFSRLANISNGHIYNLRKRRRMGPSRGRFRPSSSSPSIGQRRRPRPEGRTARFSNDVAGFQKLIAWIGPQVSRIAYEPTGPFTATSRIPSARPNFHFTRSAPPGPVLRQIPGRSDQDRRR